MDSDTVRHLAIQFAWSLHIAGKAGGIDPDNLEMADKILDKSSPGNPPSESITRHVLQQAIAEFFPD